jgi:acetylornithine/N-succinyldiaminopimelate aminotransferase
MAVLETVTAEGFLSEVKAKAEYIREKLSAIKGVKSVSGLGLMIGVELEEKAALDVVNAALEKGLLVLTAKTKVRLLPPLNITYDEIDKGLEILQSVIEE